MNEKALESLMQLFAILNKTCVKDVETLTHGAVEIFLNQQFSSVSAKKYIDYYDSFIAKYKKCRQKTNITEIRKLILDVCKKINKELEREQRLLVLLYLLEFSRFYKNPVLVEDDVFLQTVIIIKEIAGIFTISQNELDSCFAITSDSVYNIQDKRNMLIISKLLLKADTGFRYMQKSNLSGQLFVLRIKSSETYILRYIGSDQLQINDKQLFRGRIYFLPKGSTIRGKNIRPVYYSDIISRFSKSSNNEKIVFSARNINFKFNKSNNGIHDFSFEAHSGELIGILGSSGVGKSTLLNILNGNIKPQHGNIFINNNDIYEKIKQVKPIIGYIPQDDLLFEELSVYQNLYINARLSFGNMQRKETEKIVENILLKLELYDVKDLKVGSPVNKLISGGQRKRLNIALELIRSPLILFIDEPTSGLSSTDSDNVIDILKKETLEGRLIIINIHQPSSHIFKSFDKIIVLDKGGYPVYFGNPVDAVIYFKSCIKRVDAFISECNCCGNINPEQILQIIESKEIDEYGYNTTYRKIKPKQWYKLYKENKKQEQAEIKTSKIPEVNYEIAGKFKQFILFLKRNTIAKISDRQYLLISLFEAPLLSLILSLITLNVADNKNEYYFGLNQNIPAFFLMSVIVAIFLGLTISAEEIIRDRKIIIREEFLNLSRFSYINSKVFFLFIISAIQTICYVLISSLILDIRGMTLSFWLILFSTSCFADITGLVISDSLKSVVAIYILVPIIIVPQILLGGAIVEFDKLHPKLASQKYVLFIGDIMVSRWAYEAMCVHNFRNNAYQKEFFPVEQKLSDVSFKMNYLIPELKKRINTIKTEVPEKPGSEYRVNDFKIISNELKNIYISIKTTISDKEKLEKYYLPIHPDSLLVTEFSIETLNKISIYLDLVKQYYNLQFNELRLQKEEITKNLISKHSQSGFIELKNSYYNVQLADFLLRNNSLKAFSETEDEIIQTTEPVYKIPESKWGRAHFYASVKKIGSKQISTLVFNIIVIWLMTIFLYIALLKRVLKRIINFIENRN